MTPASSPHHAASLGIPVLEVAARTDPGREPSKQVNEDSHAAGFTAFGHLAVVCDGMGGHVGGKEASQLAVDTVFRVFHETPPGSTSPAALLGHAIREANRLVYGKGSTDPQLKNMGSTCVAILTHQGGTEVAHVGDSRVYLLTQQQMYPVTKDHSLVQRLVDANMLTPEQAVNHPQANQITNAIGQRPELEVEVRPTPFPLTPGDTFLLCSDGLSDECGPQDFLNVLAPHPPLETAAEQLVALANARGGHDNITVSLVRFPGGAPFALTAASTTGQMQALRPPLTTVEMPAASTPTPSMPLTPTTAMPPVSYNQPPSSGPGSGSGSAAPKFVPPPPLTSFDDGDDEPRSRAWLWILLTLFLLGGGGAAYYFLVVQPQSKDAESSEKDKDKDKDKESESSVPDEKSTKKSAKPKESASTPPETSASTSASASGVAKDPSVKVSPSKDPPVKDPSVKDPPVKDPTVKDPPVKDPTVKDPVGGETTTKPSAPPTTKPSSEFTK